MLVETNQGQHVIAAVRDEEDLRVALQAPVKNIFLLSADVRTLAEHSLKLHRANKNIFLHFDLVNGLKGDAAGIHFAAENFKLTGIISTKTQCLKYAQEAHLLAVLRVFILDSSAFKTGIAHVQTCKPDCVEVLPGVSAKIIQLAKHTFKLPVIAGGLIDSTEDVAMALKAGADAVSTSQKKLWLNPRG